MRNRSTQTGLPSFAVPAVAAVGIPLCALLDYTGLTGISNTLRIAGFLSAASIATIEYAGLENTKKTAAFTTKLFFKLIQQNFGHREKLDLSPAEPPVKKTM